MTDPSLRTYQRAARELKVEEARRAFRWHAASYVVVNAFLVAIDVFLEGEGGAQWFWWPLAGWGIGLAFHGFSVREAGQEADREAALIEARARNEGA